MSQICVYVLSNYTCSFSLSGTIYLNILLKPSSFLLIAKDKLKSQVQNAATLQSLNMEERDLWTPASGVTCNETFTH